MAIEICLEIWKCLKLERAGKVGGDKNFLRPKTQIKNYHFLGWEVSYHVIIFDVNEV